MSAPSSWFRPLTKRETAGVKRSAGLLVDRLMRQNLQPNPALAKAPVEREETRHYTKTDLLRRWLKRGERRPHEGALAGALLHLVADYEATLAAVRESRERLDSLHGRVLDLAPRLRDLCWAIDADTAEPEPEVPA